MQQPIVTAPDAPPTALQAGDPRRLRRWRVALLGLCLLLTFPPMTFPADAGLEGSWVIGLNLAAARHLVHGRDVAFTYGPLGFVLMPMDVGSNLHHAIAWRLLLQALWWASVAMLLFRLRAPLDMALLVAVCILIGLTRGRDAFSYDRSAILTFTMAVCLLLSYRERRLLWAVPAALLAAVSLLGKFNVGATGLLLLAAWSVLTLIRDRRWPTAAALAGVAALYVAAVLVLFRIYGGPLEALPGFLRSSWLIAAGFSTQMTLSNRHHLDLLAALALAILALVVLWKALRRRPDAGCFVLLMIPLFFAFKAAVVRADRVHLYSGFLAISGLLGVALCCRLGRIERLAVRAALGLACLAGIACGARFFGPRIFYSGLTNAAALAGIPAPRIDLPGTLTHSRMPAAVPAAWRRTIAGRPVDVYPWDICLAYRHDLNWRPRFVLQSYSAYHPDLDRRGAEHYRGPDAPEFILYRHVALDYQNPCAVDPQTWLEILRWYDVAESWEDLLLLRRRRDPRWREAVLLGQETARMGRPLDVAGRAAGRVVLRARLRLSASGALVAALYKASPPVMVVEYEDDRIQMFRAVWRNLEEGFLVSDLPWEPSQARQYFIGGAACPVRRITFLDPEGRFAPHIELAWLELR